MPEGPELHLSSQFINAVCKGRIFAGKILRNPIHKCADICWNSPAYTISAVSRGKEMKVLLQSLKTEEDVKPKIKNGAIVSEQDKSDKLEILFNFGMSGKFDFTSSEEKPKHAHLSFLTKTEPIMALSFVDYRRFGKWQAGADWSADRGPCVLFEYPQFRSNVLKNLADSAFNRPVCEALLNQKYFNGIGNYLRAEICYRSRVRPFDPARSVFAALPDVPEDVKIKIKDGVTVPPKAKADILQMCNTISLEVVGLGTSLYMPETEDSDVSKFNQWLQCYYQPGMKNIVDSNKRTIWFHGDPGPKVPNNGASRKRHAGYDKKHTNRKKIKKETGDDSGDAETGSTTRKSQKATKGSTTKKSQKADKQSNTKSPTATKTSRVTRASLKALPEKSTSAKRSTKRSSMTNNNGILETHDTAEKEQEMDPVKTPKVKKVKRQGRPKKQTEA